MNRDRAYIRYARNKAILHKKSICKHVHGFEWYNHDGQYSKGKIHCGCGLCKYGKKYGYPTFREEREIAHLNEALNDYYTGN